MPNIATLLTIGYEKRDVARVIELLRSAKVTVVIDVRETAWSHKPGFSKGALARDLDRAGISYVHLRDAGNPKALRRAARTHAECLAAFTAHLDRNAAVEEAFDRAVGSALLREQRVCLLCFERHPDDCHRGILAERWAARHGGRVHHLDPAGCPRLLNSV